MVQEYGKPAMFAKSKARRRSNFTFLVVFLIITFSEGAAFYLIFGLSQVSGGALILALLMMALYGAVKIIDPQMRKLGRERIKYWHGGQTEALVALMLRELEGPWHVFHGVKLQEGWDIDHIAVGPSGVFCISTKNQRGCFTLEGDKIHVNGQPSDMAPQAMHRKQWARRWNCESDLRH